MAREADLRYSPLVKDLQFVVCFPTETQEQKNLAIQILDKLIAEYEEGTE